MKLNTVDKKKVFEEINNEIVKGSLNNYISITNTEAMYIGSNDISHAQYINNSFLSLCDGTGLLIAAKMNGLKIKKYHGPDFFDDILQKSQIYGWSHYFLGGKKGVSEKLAKKYINKYPKLKILGTYSPPFRDLKPDEENQMIKKINKLKPNFLWVSLGLPKQEKWIAKYQESLNVNFSVGVGAAFDFHTNEVKRAPVFFQRIGLEWLYRTFFERRLIVRQIKGFKFMLNSIFSFNN